MAIVKRPKGEAAAYAEAGRMIGGAKAKERQEEQALLFAAKQWELNKAMMLDQQKFENQLYLRQWEFEKARRASEIDFEQEEKERQRYNAEAVAGEKTLLKTPMPDGERAKALFELWQQYPEASNLLKYSGFDIVAERHALKPQTIAQQRRELEAIVGPSVSKFMTMKELQAEAAQLGTTPEAIQAGEEIIPQSTAEPMTAINPTTGERIISYDSGKTWEIAATGGQFRGYGATGEF